MGMRTSEPGTRPSSLGGELLLLARYRELLFRLISKDLKVKYRGSYLGYLWSLLNPLSLILVYSIVLRFIMRTPIENYPLMVITGVIPWVFFSGTLIASTDSVVKNDNLVKKIYFPREILPISTVLFNLIQFALALVVFLPAIVFFLGGLPPTLALLPGIVLLHTLFTLGLALFVSAITTFYKDVRYLTEVCMMVVFWATPIVYPQSLIPASFAPFYRLNPLASFFFSYQDVVYNQKVPGLDHIAEMVFWTALSLLVGLLVFRRLSHRFAEEL